MKLARKHFCARALIYQPPWLFILCCTKSLREGSDAQSYLILREREAAAAEGFPYFAHPLTALTIKDLSLL